MFVETNINKHKNPMLQLQSHHIVDLYCWVDNNLPKSLKTTKAGRPPVLSSSELITILLWNTLVVQQKTIKDLYDWVSMYHHRDFPKLPKYNAFIDHCHRVTPLCLQLLEQLLCDQEPIRFLDSTMVPVCKTVRANSHKVAKSIAAFGKNHQGWHYGFKLHASVNKQRQLCGIVLTPANFHDAQAMRWILNEHADIAVGDGGYTARVMQEIIWKSYGTIVVSPPHPKQKTKLLAGWQRLLLRMRPKVEAVFDILKEHLQLVTSFPRSIKGYLFHYVRIILAYQLIALAKT